MSMEPPISRDTDADASDRKGAKKARPTREIERLKNYLRANPNALDADTELVELLMPPAVKGGRNVLDMQSFMIDRLKRRASESELREDNTRAALAADSLDERRVHHAILTLARARSFDHLLDTINEDLAHSLTVQCASIGIEAAEGDAENSAFQSADTINGPVRLLKPGMVDQIIGADRAITLGAPPQGVRIFPPKAAPIRSFCAARLTFTPEAPPAMLLIGARNASRFNRSVSANRYAFLAKYLEEMIRLWLDLPPLQR